MAARGKSPGWGAVLLFDGWITEKKKTPRMSFLMGSVLIGIPVALAIVASAGAGTVGINYGRVVENIPSASQVVQLVKSQGIDELKLYDADPVALRAFSGTGVKITIALPNEQLGLFMKMEDINGSTSFTQLQVADSH